MGYTFYRSVDDSRIVIADEDGVANNTTIDLALVSDGGVAPSLLKITRDGYGRVTNTQQAKAVDVPVESLAGATWDNLQEFLNVMNSPGLVEGGGFTDAGSGNLSYSSMRIAIRPTDGDTSTLYMGNVAAGTIAIPNDSLTRFIGVQYNSGSPNVIAKTSDTWDYDTEFPLGEVANLGGTLFPLFNPFKVGDPITNIIQRFDAQATAIRSSAGGLELSTDGTTRNLDMTAGTIWARLNDYPVAARSSTTVPLYRVVPTGGTPPLGFTSGITQWPNTQYINGTTLTTMTNNRWAVLWVFVNIGTGAWGFAHGTAQYNNSSGAAQEQVPSYLTQNFLRQNLLVGRLLFEKNATTAIIESAFTRVFSVQPVSNHNQLSGLQGGALGEYYHLTASELADAQSAVQSVVAGTNITVNNTDPRNPIVTAIAQAHNSLTGLQGGQSGQYYHLTAVQNTAVAALTTSSIILGLTMKWNSGTSLSVSSGVAGIQSTGTLLNFPSTITKSSLSLTASTMYHVYGFSNAGTPDIELSTTVPAAAYFGTARSKTGDTTRRYIGSVLTDSSGNLYQFGQNGDEINYVVNLLAPFRVLSGGTALTRTNVSLTSVIPVTSSYVIANTINNTDQQVFIDIPEIGNVGAASRYTCLANQRTPIHAFVASRTLQYFYAVSPVGSGAFMDVWGYKYDR